MTSGYPASDEYSIAVQIPASFADPELRGAKVKVNNIGYPVALGGGFALTYEFAAGKKRMAVRCFHKKATGLEEHYSAISRHLASVSGPFVKFEFQPQGIRVNGRPFPLVKMDWASGEPLGSYLETAHADKAALARLVAAFRDLSRYLAGNGLAHGDLQNGNVLVGPAGLTLIDYDGMYVPGMAVGGGSELGQVHFQHPGRTAGDFGPLMDRFSLIVIDISLRALIERPALFDKYSNGENILLSAADYRAPLASEVFRDLRTVPAVAADADRLAALCSGPVSAVPSLEAFLAARGSGPAARLAGPSQAALHPQGYIGAFPVVDGADYAAVSSAVGDRIELVARVVNVHVSKTRYGQPYVFLNFGDWKANIAKANIWSTGLKEFPSQPDRSWEGKWVSVTGLVDPAWENKRFRTSHVSITISGRNQIRIITEAEAKRRLASRLAAAPEAAPSAPAGSRLTSASSIPVQGTPVPTLPPQRSRPAPAVPIVRTPAVVQAPAPVAAVSASNNQKIVEVLKRTRTQAAATQPATPPVVVAPGGRGGERPSPETRPEPALPVPSPTPQLLNQTLTGQFVKFVRAFFGG